MIQVERIGRFEVQERLRANPFVIVYRGRDPFDGRRVQIRFCVATDESIRKRFFEAAEKAASLRHPNIATVFEFGSGDGKPYLVQEAFSEESLGDLLARGEPSEDVLKLYYLVQIAKGLQYAHSVDVLHRELRPASVLVDRSGEVKIADFGTARLASAFAQLGNGAHRWPAVGWLLPELLLGLELDARSDIYGFGALAFELLTGTAPFVAESLAALVPQILESEPRPLGVHWAECPPELDRLVLRCLSRDPGQRFGSMAEVVDELGMIVPVTDPSEVFEEEKTMVIEDINTVYVAANQQDTLEPVTEQTAAAREKERTTAERPVARPRLDWGPMLERLQQGGRRTCAWAKETLGGLASGSQALLASFSARGRTLGLLIAALLLFGVVGWSLVGTSDAELGPLPTVAPDRPILPRPTTQGRLLLDAQPWGEVLSVVDQAGDPVDGLTDPFTPLMLELDPGEYRVELSRPGSERVETCYVTVTASSTSSCELQLAVVDTNDFFKQTGWWQ